jgi:outer membrane biosynthesis protein TonB
MKLETRKLLPDNGLLGELTFHVKDAADVMFEMLDEQWGRSDMPPVSRSRHEGMLEELSSNPPPPNPSSPPVATQHSSPPPAPAPEGQQHKRPSATPAHSKTTSGPPSAQSSPRQSSSHIPPPPHSSTSTSDSASGSQPPSAGSSSQQRRNKPSQPQLQQLHHARDDFVSDAAWQQLLADKEAADRAAKALADESSPSTAKIAACYPRRGEARYSQGRLKRSRKTRLQGKRHNVNARCRNAKSKQRECPGRNWQMHIR